MRQNERPSYITAYVSYEDIFEFDNSNWKRGFCNQVFSGHIYFFKIRLLFENNLLMAQIVFPSLFKYLTVFVITIWQRVKPSHPKERTQKLILVIFSIYYPLERVIKFRTRCNQWIFTDMIVLFFFARFIGDWT